MNYNVRHFPSLTHPMLDNLTARLAGIVKQMRGEARLTEKNIQDALREVRVALLEADVALPVVKDFVAKVREGAVGERVVKSVTPGQMVVKLVHDELVKTLSAGEGVEPGLDLNAPAPVPILR